MTSLQTLRHAAQDALDDTLRGVAYAATVDSVSLFAIASSAANLSANRYDGRWVFHIPASGFNGQQRVVMRGSYLPASGTVGVAPNWGAPSPNDSIEITSLFPCSTGVLAAETSYRALINAALRMLIIPDRYALTIATGGSYALPSWLREDRLVRVLEPGPTGGIPVDASWRRPRLVADAQGNALTLDVPFLSASGVLSLDVMRPADTVIWAAGSGGYADSTVGLVNEGDEAKVEAEEVVEVFKMLAFEALMVRGDDNRWAGRWKDQVPIARAQPHFDRAQESPAARAVPEQAAA